MLLGKSLALKYSQEQRQLEFKMEYFSAVDFGKNKAVKSCYDKARDAIFQLGYGLDNGILDEEGSMLLDLAMIDYAREVNALNKCNRCLLCRKWKKLHKSHICPESVLKEIARANFDESSASIVTSMTGQHDVKTPKSETKWLLCGACEQLLSQHGETQFAVKFFRLLYPEIKSTSTIHYDKSLYDFCTGVAFRALCLTNFSYLHNKSEIYNFFLACRNHLISLLGENHHYSPPEIERKPEFFIFRNPIGLYSTEGVREDILSGVLQSEFAVNISTHHLQSGNTSNVCEGCFLMITLGGIIVLTKFSPDQTFTMPPSFVPISIDGGEYVVPGEFQRWTDIPAGVMEVFKDSVLHIQSRISEVFWGKVPISKHKSTQIPPSWNTEIAQRTDSPLPDALKELQQSLLSGITQEAISTTNLLPEGFNISRTPVPTVTLPCGHIVLKHNHNGKKDATLLLAADCNACSSDMYVVVVHRKKQREVLYGFQLQENQGEYAIKDLLVTSSVEGANSAFFDGVVSEIVEDLEYLWNDFGSFQGILHHSEIERYVNLRLYHVYAWLI